MSNEEQGGKNGADLQSLLSPKVVTSQVANLNSLPKYVYSPGNTRLWLTLTTNVTGQWLIGYSDVDGNWLDPYVITADTIEQAIKDLQEVL